MEYEREQCSWGPELAALLGAGSRQSRLCSPSVVSGRCLLHGSPASEARCSGKEFRVGEHWPLSLDVFKAGTSHGKSTILSS